MSVASETGKLAGVLSRKLGLGAGVTWAGEVALKIDRNILPKIIPTGAKVILVAGTNGKTTTAKLLASMLPDAVLNKSGANLINGLVGTVIQSKSAPYYVFEVDENNLVTAARALKPEIVILLNLFRDQLDRYGEVDKIAKNWEKLEAKAFVINADDPQLAFLGKSLKNVFYFGLGNSKFFLEKMPHATDSIYCPNCGSRLKFSGFYLSHLGEYRCGKCGFGHPRNDREYQENWGIEGIYNYYNILAAESAAQILKIKADFAGFKPAFGRGEKVGNATILLSKNPAGFTESLRTAINRGPILLVLNDRIPDGTDISWIWDVDFELLQKSTEKIYVWGDRKLDLALRLKYAEVPFEIKHELNVSWILPTYSAMLDIRKELTGKKIL